MIRNLFLFVILLAGMAFSQPAFEKYKNNEAALIDLLVNTAIKNNPQVIVAENKVALAEENHFLAKLSWLNNVNLTYQYVPSYVTTSTTGSSSPQFGLGISVNLGNIVATPGRISQAAKEEIMAQADYKTFQNYLRAETIRRYSEYSKNVVLLAVRTQAVNDAESTTLLLKHRFENGEASLEEYNRVLRSYTDNQERRAESIGTVLAMRASLEEIIGVKLEELN